MEFQVVVPTRIFPNSFRNEDHQGFLKKRLYDAGIARLEIERAANKAKIIILPHDPRIVIGKKGCAD